MSAHWRGQDVRDENEGAIVLALELIPVAGGVTVQTLRGGKSYKGQRMPDAGTLDLLVGHSRVNYILEVKVPDSRKRCTPLRDLRDGGKYLANAYHYGEDACRELRATQHEWILAWRGLPPAVVTTAREAAAAIGLCLTCGDAASDGLCAVHQADVAF